MRIRLVDYYNEHRVALAYVSVLPGNPRQAAAAAAVAAATAPAADAVLYQRITSLLFTTLTASPTAMHSSAHPCRVVSVYSVIRLHDVSRFFRFSRLA